MFTKQAFLSGWGGGYLPNKILVDIVYYFGELAVNCFILISGYFFESTKFKWKKICLIIFQCLFYIFFSLLILEIFDFDSNWSIKKFIFPIMRNKYWFVTVYLFIYVLTPYLKIFLKHISKHELRLLIATQLLIWSVYPTIVLSIAGNDSLETMPYYNRLIWLIVIYMIGAYIKMYNPKITSTFRKSAVLFFVVACCLLLYIMICELNILPIHQTATYYWTPNSILELLFSIGLFGMFKNLQIKENKLINYIASCTLGIYMLHDGELVNFWWNHIFKNRNYQFDSKLWIQIMYATFIIMMIGIVVDSARKLLEYIIKKIFIKII